MEGTEEMGTRRYGERGITRKHVGSDGRNKELIQGRNGTGNRSQRR